VTFAAPIIATVLGEHGVTIAGMYNARGTDGGEALTVYGLDYELPEAWLSALTDHDRISDVRQLDLTNA